MGKLPLYKVGDSANCYSYAEELELLQCIVLSFKYDNNVETFYYELQVQDSFNYPVIYRYETELL